MKQALFVLGICFLIGVCGCAFYIGWVIHRGFDTRESPGFAETVLAETMRDAAVPSRYKAMKNPVTATPDVLKEGMTHWADHCAICHANNGSGDTMYGKTMYPRPPDLRQNDTQQMSDGELYYDIEDGIRLSGMPAFGTGRDDDPDSWKLVAFIRHLPSLSQGEQTDMKKMNPKSPGELQEEQEEENFLRGSPTPSQPQPVHDN